MATDPAELGRRLRDGDRSAAAAALNVIENRADRDATRALLAELVRLPAIERLDLAPLPLSDAFALVTSLAADLGLGERELRSLAERSEGNAFFAEELVSAAGGGGLPEALADVLLTRFERLPAPARQVLRVAAVAGRSVAEDTLAEVSDLEPGAFTDPDAVGPDELLPPALDAIGALLIEAARLRAVEERLHEELREAREDAERARATTSYRIRRKVVTTLENSSVGRGMLDVYRRARRRGR